MSMRICVVHHEDDRSGFPRNVVVRAAGTVGFSPPRTPAGVLARAVAVDATWAGAQSASTKRRLQWNENEHRGPGGSLERRATGKPAISAGLRSWLWPSCSAELVGTKHLDRQRERRRRVGARPGSSTTSSRSPPTSRCCFRAPRSRSRSALPAAIEDVGGRLCLHGPERALAAGGCQQRRGLARRPLGAGRFQIDGNATDADKRVSARSPRPRRRSARIPASHRAGRRRERQQGAEQELQRRLRQGRDALAADHAGDPAARVRRAGRRRHPGAARASPASRRDARADRARQPDLPPSTRRCPRWCC